MDKILAKSAKLETGFTFQQDYNTKNTVRATMK